MKLNILAAVVLAGAVATTPLTADVGDRSACSS